MCLKRKGKILFLNLLQMVYGDIILFHSWGTIHSPFHFCYCYYYSLLLLLLIDDDIIIIVI